MATSSQAAPATTSVVGGDGTTTTTSQTIVGSHIFKIDGFSATKDFRIGRSVKSSTFRVGGHDWYVKCYPCGVDQKISGSVTLFLCRQYNHPGRVSAKCKFTLMKSLNNGCYEELVGHPGKLVTIRDDDFEHSLPRTDFIKREELQSLLKDDCFQVRCIVFIDKFPDVLLPQPLATETVAVSHMAVLTVDGYSKIREAHEVGHSIAARFRFAGHSWCLGFYPRDEDEDDVSAVSAYICLDQDAPNCTDEVKVRLEMTLLTHAGQIISSIRDFYTFSDITNERPCEFLRAMNHESSPLLQDGIQIRCDMAVVKGIAVVPQTNKHQGFGNLVASHLVTDVTFEVGGKLISAHKTVLATRSKGFLAEFFGRAGKENAGVTEVLHVDDMEPRVFEALLHFIYTDTLPEVREEDKVVLAQGLLVAADRYALERLKLICSDVLCSCIDATTAIATKELAEKHGCLKLKDACIKVIRDWLAKATP